MPSDGRYCEDNSISFDLWSWWQWCFGPATANRFCFCIAPHPVYLPEYNWDFEIQQLLTGFQGILDLSLCLAGLTWLCLISLRFPMDLCEVKMVIEPFYKEKIPAAQTRVSQSTQKVFLTSILMLLAILLD